jgi:hypothetical protein
MDCSKNTDSELHLFKSSFNDMIMYIMFIIYSFTVGIMTKHIYLHKTGEPFCITLSNEEVIIYKTIIIVSFLINFMMIFIWFSKIPVYKSRSLKNEETLYDTIIYLIFPIVYNYIIWNFFYILNYGSISEVNGYKNISKYCINMSEMNLAFLKIAIIMVWVLIVILIMVGSISTFDPFYALVNSCNIIIT